VFGLAAQMAKAMGAEFTLLAVNELIGGAGGKSGAAAYVWEQPEFQHILDSAAAVAEKAGVSDAKKETMKSRDVARTIVVFAEDHGIDHIVIGTAGRGGVARLMLGSISRDVVFRAHCPVTVTR
jgi:nucleotide-binding universal stress UspA family protein